MCERYGTHLCNEELLEWADVIAVMDELLFKRLDSHAEKKYLNKVRVLGIPDDYQYMDDELVKLLKRKCDFF
jgi:predicted protein tyrosine phosphatase